MKNLRLNRKVGMSLNNIDLSQFLDGFYKLVVQLLLFDGVSSVASMPKKKKKKKEKRTEKGVECPNLKDFTKVICYVEGKTS